jgi:hypothetical protein
LALAVPWQNRLPGRLFGVRCDRKLPVLPLCGNHHRNTFLTKKGLISPKLPPISDQAEEEDLAIDQDLAVAGVSAKHEEAMRSSPVQ